jgi:hypothetical protein
MSGKLGVVEKGQLDLVTEGGNIGLREQQFAGPLPLPPIPDRARAGVGVGTRCELAVELGEQREAVGEA